MLILANIIYYGLKTRFMLLMLRNLLNPIIRMHIHIDSEIVQIYRRISRDDH